MPKSSFTRLVAAMLALCAVALFAQTPISVNPWRKTSTGTTTPGTVGIGKTITSYNGVATVAGGVPIVVAKADAATQSANISSTPLYAVPASGGGMYRATCYVVITQAASSSSTMPPCVVSSTDPDSNATTSPWVTGTSATNTVGTNSNIGTQAISVKAGTTIQYSTASYASSGVTAMQYALHLKLEYLGN